MRLREWNDIYQQLKTSAKLQKAHQPIEPASYDQIHQSILPGLLNNIGFNYELKEYIGARGLKFFIFPGSSQFKPTPKWIMASELVETTKLYARNVARIQPEWVEKCADHLIKKAYFEPHWSKKHRNVMAFEKVTLYGLEIIPKRLVSYSNIDPILSRELFIRGALVNGDIHTQIKFFHANLALLDEVDDLENKARSRDILVDDETLFNYYEQVIDQAIVNQVTFEQWVKKLKPEQLDKLYFEKSDIMRHNAANVTENLFPESFNHNQLQLPLNYHFEPGTQKDGITITIPQMVLHQIKPISLEWLVPGMLKEKIIALMRALPKNIRKYCVPIPQYADAIMESISYDTNQNLKSLLVKELIRITGIVFDETVWNDAELEAHLVMNINVINPKGEIVKSGRNLLSLQQQIKPEKNINIKQNHKAEHYKNWAFADLKPEETINQHGIKVTVYPCLLSKEDSVEIINVNTLTEAEATHKKGILKLLEIHYYSAFKNLRKQVPQFDKISMLASTIYTKLTWEQDFIQAVLQKTFPIPDTRLLRQKDFNQIIKNHELDLEGNIQLVSKALFNIFTGYHQLKKSLKRKSIPLDLLDLYQSIGNNLEKIIYPGFLADTPVKWLERIPFYIQASESRIEKAPRKFLEDRQHTLEVDNLHSRLSAKMTSQQLLKHHHEVIEISWLIQELWISWYSQEIRTIQPISIKRIEKLITTL
jgi:ATP-dependent helicase HrpA